MGRASVRAAVASWLAPPAVPHLNEVETSQPKRFDGAEWYAAPGERSGAVSFVHIEHEHEERIALGGTHPNGGQKMAHYDVGLVLMFRSNKREAQAGMDDYDEMLDAIKARLRQDHQLGNSLIFEAAEPHIEIHSDLPKQTKERIEIWTVVRFSVSEWLPCT